MMVFVISSLSLTTTARMHVLSSCDTRIKRCKISKSTLLKMVLLRILWSENGTEHTNKSFNHFCNNNKIKREYTVPETPEQNGVAERYNRTVVETARSLLIESKLPKSYWLKAVDRATYVINLVKKDKTEKNLQKKLGSKTKNRTSESLWMSKLR